MFQQYQEDVSVYLWFQDWDEMVFSANNRRNWPDAEFKW